MTKPRTKNHEEQTVEIEDGKKKIRQFENREKLLRQKISSEKRRERSHRLIVRSAGFESNVPKTKCKRRRDGIRRRLHFILEFERGYCLGD